MNLSTQNTAFITVTSILEATSGEETAVTIATLCMSTGLKRRNMEELLQVRLSDFPFLVVSTGAGYFRPRSEEEINHCLASLQSRAINLFLRKRTIIRNALRSGYPRQGKTFSARTPAADLFTYAAERRGKCRGELLIHNLPRR
jgi:hypothetical protein